MSNTYYVVITNPGHSIESVDGPWSIDRCIRSLKKHFEGWDMLDEINHLAYYSPDMDQVRWVEFIKGEPVSTPGLMDDYEVYALREGELHFCTTIIKNGEWLTTLRSKQDAVDFANNELPSSAWKKIDTLEGTRKAMLDSGYVLEE